MQFYLELISQSKVVLNFMAIELGLKFENADALTKSIELIDLRIVKMM